MINEIVDISVSYKMKYNLLMHLFKERFSTLRVFSSSFYPATIVCRHYISKANVLVHNFISLN